MQLLLKQTPTFLTLYFHETIKQKYIFFSNKKYLLIIYSTFHCRRQLLDKKKKRKLNHPKPTLKIK